MYYDGLYDIYYKSWSFKLTVLKHQVYSIDANLKSSHYMYT